MNPSRSAPCPSWNTHTINPKTFFTVSGSWFSTSRIRGDGTHFDNIWGYGRPGDGNPSNESTDLFRSWDNLNIDDDAVPILLESASGGINDPSDLVNLYVSNNLGEMVPLSALVSTVPLQGADVLYRHNTYDSATINGVPNAAGGFSSGDAMLAMERVAGTLPPGYKFEWTDSSFEERKSGNMAPLALALSLPVELAYWWTIQSIAFGAVLFSLLVQAPSLRERIAQGGLIGYLIIALGGLALLIALERHDEAFQWLDAEGELQEVQALWEVTVWRPDAMRITMTGEGSEAFDVDLYYDGWTLTFVNHKEKVWAWAAPADSRPLTTAATATDILFLGVCFMTLGSPFSSKQESSR